MRRPDVAEQGGGERGAGAEEVYEDRVLLGGHRVGAFALGMPEGGASEFAELPWRRGVPDGHAGVLGQGRRGGKGRRGGRAGEASPDAGKGEPVAAC
jgi:hypothetical protein